MFHEIAVIGAGAMGSAVAARLNANGAKILTLLEGRSEATRRRADAAGMIEVAPEAIADAEIVLSIVPPGEAIGVAEMLAPVFARSERKPTYADCNAVDVATVKRIGEIITASNAAFARGDCGGL